MRFLKRFWGFAVNRVSPSIKQKLDAGFGWVTTVDNAPTCHWCGDRKDRRRMIFEAGFAYCNEECRDEKWQASIV